MKIFLILIFILLVLMLVVFALYLMVGAMAFHFSLSRNGKLKRKIEQRNQSQRNEDKSSQEYFSHNNFEKISIASSDDLKLYGFYKDNGKTRLAILVHGYGGTHFDMYSYAKIYEDLGYDIFAMDLRTHGESEGDTISMGLYEHYDLIRWIEKMLSIKPNYKIVLHGISMGASTVCMALGEPLPNNVICGIEDSGYDNANNELYYVYSKTKFLSNFLYKIFYHFTKNAKGLTLKAIDSCEKLKNSKLPVLFIHGDSDNFVPTSMVYKLYDCLPDSRKALYICKDSAHIKSIETDKQEYKKQIVNFLSRYNM